MRLSHRLATGLAFAAVALAPAAAHADSPYAKGPEPTVSELRGPGGPFKVTRALYSDPATPGFGAATVYWPTSGAAGDTYGGVAFAPGWTESSSVVNWLAYRTATFGFTTIVFNTNNALTDLPTQRSSQLLAALGFLTNTSAAKPFTDITRLAVVGHSMGGGATLEASRARPSLKASVGLEPWDLTTNFSGNKVPQLIVGAQNDVIAPIGSHAIPFYKSLPATTPKEYVELAGADHFVSNSPSSKVGAATIAWLKRFVDSDTRYSQFLGTDHPALLSSELSSFQTNALF